MKSVKILLIALVVLFFVIGAGCISTVQSETPTAIQTSTATQIPIQDEVTVNDIYGVWYSKEPYDGDYIKISFYNGSAYEQLYTDASVKKTKMGDYLDPKTGKLTPFDKKIDGLLVPQWSIYDASHISMGGVLLEFDEDKLSLTDTNGHVYYKFVPDVNKKNPHNSDDYVESGDYYLEDDFGQSFTDVLWKGDVSKYIGDLTGAQWIQYVRYTYAPSYHVQELSGYKIYLTVDEICSGDYATLVDCDDLAMVMARGLKEMGIDVCILVFEDHMDIGIHKDDISKLKCPAPPFGLGSNSYAAYQSSTEIMYNDYYYVDVAFVVGSIDVAHKCTQSGFEYDMELVKMIVL